MQPGHLAGLSLEADVHRAAAAAAAAAEAEEEEQRPFNNDSPPLNIPPLLAQAALASGADPGLLPEYEAEPLFGPHELRHEVDYDEATGIIRTAKKDQGDEEDGRPVSVIELFFDLVFAALLSKLGGILVGELRHPVEVLFYILVFQLVYQSWLHVTSFINRFASETASDKLFIAWNLTSLGGVGINVARCMGAEPHSASAAADTEPTQQPPCPTHDCRGVAGWLAFGRAGVCLWFVLTMVHTRAQHSERGFRFSRISLGTNLVSVGLLVAAAVAFGSPFLSSSVGITLLVTAAVVDVVHIPILWFCAPFYRRSFVPVDANLAAERFGLIYLISLGELVLGSVEGNIRAGQPPHERLRATAVMVLGVLTGLLFQTSYFSLYDLRADRAKKHALEVSVLRSWAILHVTSALALLAALVAATFARLSLRGRLTPRDRLTLALTLALKIVLFSGSNRLFLRHVSVAYGWAADALAIAALGLVGGLGHDTLPDDVLFVGLLALVWALLVLARGVLLPVRLTESGLEEVLSIAAEAQIRRRRQEEEERKKKRRSLKRLLGELPFVRRQQWHQQQQHQHGHHSVHSSWGGGRRHRQHHHAQYYMVEPPRPASYHHHQEQEQ